MLEEKAQFHRPSRFCPAPSRRREIRGDVFTRQREGFLLEIRMPRFACPICKHIISASEEQRGTIVACAGCDKKIRVPKGKSAAASEAVASTSPSARPASSLEADVVDQRDEPRKAPLKNRREDEREESDAPRKDPPSLKKRLEEEEDEPRPSKKQPALDLDGDAPWPGKKRSPDDEDEDAAPRRKRARADDDDDAPRRSRLEDDEAAPGHKQGQGGLLVSISGIVGSLGALLFLALFILIISGRGPRWLMEFIQEKLEANGIPPLVAIGVTAAVFLIPVGLWVLVSLKGTILGAMPDELDFRPAVQSKFPDLDTDELDRLTEAFEALGFEQVMDYTVRTEIEVFPKGFGRLLVNQEEGCYAEINQVFTPAGVAVPLRCMIATHMDDGWSLTTTNRAPSKEGYLMRRPRAPWRSLPEEDPEDLLTHHRKMRKKMLKALDIEPVKELSCSAYFAREKVANRERKDAVRGRWSAGILIEFFFFASNPKYEWLGAYAALAD
jgi:hypothetical protein